MTCFMGAQTLKQVQRSSKACSLIARIYSRESVWEKEARLLQRLAAIVEHGQRARRLAIVSIIGPEQAQEVVVELSAMCIGVPAFAQFPPLECAHSFFFHGF